MRKITERAVESGREMRLNDNNQTEQNFSPDVVVAVETTINMNCEDNAILVNRDGKTDNLLEIKMEAKALQQY